MGNEIVYKIYSDQEQKNMFALDNRFIRMPNSLTINALQLFGLALSKIDFTKDNGPLIKVSIPFSEMRQALNTESHNIEFYKKTIEELQNKAFVKIDKGTFYVRANLTPTAYMENGVITLSINNELNQFVQLLHANFTTFKVLNMAQFTSRFSYILYMNLCSWNNHSIDRADALDERERYYTTRQLKEMFDLPIEAYCSKSKNGKMKFNRVIFEKKVIDFAVKEINSYSNIQVVYKKTYNGKKVDKYIFSWFRRDGYNCSLGMPNK